MTPPPLATRLLAEGDGWRVQQVTCRSSPADPRFEEQHAWTSIAAVLSGVFTYRTHGGRALMTPGALLLGECGRCFECGHEHGTGDVCVSFHLSPGLTEEVAAGLDGTGRRTFASPGLPPDDRFLPLLAEARALARAPDPLRAEQLCLGFAATALAADLDAGERAPTPSDERRAAGAVQIIEARLAEPLSIAGLAAEVGLSRRRFATAFRRAVGLSPYAYILNRRLDAAAARLRDGGRSVLDVALDAGFGDLSEFTRRFRGRFGHPPARFARLGRTGGARAPRRR